MKIFFPFSLTFFRQLELREGIFKYLQNRQANSFQKDSEESTRKRIEARKNYLTKKVAVPNLFSLTNQLLMLYSWYHFKQSYLQKKELTP